MPYNNKQNNDNVDDVDDIVNIIDNFISADGGHMNFSFDINSNYSFSESISNDCLKNMPCSTPTLFEGVDDLNN